MLNPSFTSTMNSSSCLKLVIIVFLVQFLDIKSCRGRIFSFEMHHRLSEPIRKWSDSSGGFSVDDDFPREGSYEYYAELAAQDRMLRSRSLSDRNSPLALSDGNSTTRISSLGFLHYTTIQIGTPGTKFLVALDTGSDLFWVPCNCTRCAPTDSVTYSPDFDLGTYDPGRSSTSKRVACDNALCSRRNECSSASSSCPYTVSYISTNTSSSGFLVEDVLHLTSEEDGRRQNEHDITAYITFGCGQVQTGSFLEIAALNGLLGLGMEKISVPSMLSEQGFITNSFSMCFGRDGIGRISFGDKGSIDQNETRFILNPFRPSYNVMVLQIRIGMTLMNLNITSLFDSGTSFTYLTEPVYGGLSESFNSQIQDKRRRHDPRIPFEYCYDMGSDAIARPTPSISLIMEGGDDFTVHDPIILISTQSEHVYCLAVLKSADVNIIGQNFMTGYRVVFDRERLVLGWKKFNCYEKEEPESRFRNRKHSSAASSGFSATLSYDNHVRRLGEVVGLGYLVILLVLSGVAIYLRPIYSFLITTPTTCLQHIIGMRSS